MDDDEEPTPSDPLLRSQIEATVYRYLESRGLRRRQLGDQFEEIGSSSNDDHHGMVPADESSIKNMTLNNKVIICKEEISDQQDCCAVCLEQLDSVGSEVSQMPCSHQFHTACILTWLNHSHYCPVCRYVMPTPP
ncbi:Zinc finger, RING-type [Corchorus capsularis]|uniref:RING-type E3 ubiquitin transferase n=1 Tax=Corchorus capsularis TaxID=210143 RepID=A0A1R3G8G7_COCAP|nr:Zinc finger, RING-type [Corchorus capsularis]